MADSWHVNWLSEGVEKWNRRRKKVGFSPDLSGVKFFDLLPEDYRDSPKTSRYFEGIDFSGSNLSGANLSGLNFQNAKFSNAILSNADMSKSNFIGANFKKADLSGADLEKSLFDRAVFEFANLRGVSFKGVGLEGALFIESDVSEEQIETAKDHSAQVFLTQKSYRDYLSTAIYQKNAEGLDVWPKVLADGGMAKSVDTKSDDRTVKHKYDVFFGTNRNPMFERGALTDFGRNIHSELSLGVCEVVIPEGHRMGSLGSPRWKRLINRYDDRIKLDQIIYLNEDLFWKLIRETSN
ncbi:MAG: hypothetical protein CL535_05005 [Ahrensia sp.]|nr:hypothetical protein [Ahrensia sp.]|tara:strand:- start:25575 stop:26459 length:885 start_codon:yes stop_codon:yes gene_type:complete